MNLAEIRRNLEAAREASLCNDAEHVSLSFAEADSIGEALSYLEELMRAIAGRDAA